MKSNYIVFFIDCICISDELDMYNFRSDQLLRTNFRILPVPNKQFLDRHQLKLICLVFRCLAMKHGRLRHFSVMNICFPCRKTETWPYFGFYLLVSSKLRAGCCVIASHVYSDMLKTNSRLDEQFIEQWDISPAELFDQYVFQSCQYHMKLSRLLFASCISIVHIRLEIT